ncbi:MAG: S9 family peptidase [Flavobacteriaceae bacterium]|nr:S9 family peptidase [Flavobacteriaceae bacterium]
MSQKIFQLFLFFISFSLFAQTTMTPEKLWEVKRITAMGLSKDQSAIVYAVGTPDMATNKIPKKFYLLNLQSKSITEIAKPEEFLPDTKISANGRYRLSTEEVKMLPVFGKDLYPELDQSNVMTFEDIPYRHWDSWEDGKFNHIFVTEIPIPTNKKDLLEGKMFDCPILPFGGDEDFIWHPSLQKVIYVTRAFEGKPTAMSTNTDLFEYDLKSGTTINLTDDNEGYDLQPSFNAKGVLAWLQMKRDGYEADKQDLIILNGTNKVNLTAAHDHIHVESFQWSADGKSIYFTSAINGTVQLYSVLVDNSVEPGKKVKKSKVAAPKLYEIKQLTQGDFDITGIIGQVGGSIYVTRQDFNHAVEIFAVDNGSGQMTQISHVNDAFYAQIKTCKTERRYITTADNQQLMSWIVYPPDFDPTKKYPTLLYCQGGPQSPLTQFYSFRWNLHLMASQGYIIVAPNRRGMHGHGTKWNEDISKDWGGKETQDLLAAIDDMSKESYVDKDRLGAIGASFGGFSVFYLAGNHENRFKTFIAHAGIFDFRSMYGTTEELFFENWEKGGAYWEKDNAVAQKSFAKSPSNFVQNWNTPIMIIQGGKDYRVPESQAMQAFQAARLRDVKAKLLLFPDENHWILKPQNALVWQREFYKWLKETL